MRLLSRAHTLPHTPPPTSPNKKDPGGGGRFAVVADQGVRKTLLQKNVCNNSNKIRIVGIVGRVTGFMCTCMSIRKREIFQEDVKCKHEDMNLVQVDYDQDENFTVMIIRWHPLPTLLQTPPK